MGKIPCTVGILTFNSGETLRRALESVKYFAEIIICDGGSTDDTLLVAKEYNCKIIFQSAEFKNSDGSVKNFSGVRNQCLDAASFDWFLYVDSDEMISPGLEKEIKEITNSQTDTYIYNVPIRIFVEDRLILHSSNYPGYQHRFFNKKSEARFVKEVHEKIKYDKEKVTVKNMQNPWYVYLTGEKARHYFRYSKKYIVMEVERSKNQPFFHYVRYGVWWNILTVGKIFLKSMKNYCMYGFKTSMPISIEVGRMLYILAIMYFLTLNRCTRLLRKSEAR